MSFKSVYELPRLSIPNLAGAIITACDELIAVLVESAIGKREYMSLESTEEFELLLLLFIYLCDQFCISETSY